jgi:hypothetical protein
VLGVLLLGGAGFVAVNLLEPAPRPGGGGLTGLTGPTAGTGAKAPTGATGSSRLSGTPDETPQIPALRSLASEGLTIAAEGLPQVLTEEGAPPSPVLAGLESCRYSYGIWEFSPNKMFRFITTCGALEGQVLAGGYEIDGSSVLMSPLRTEEGEASSVFEVEKPSMMTTHVKVRGLPAVVVKQRITVMRTGMDGESFHRSYAGKNTIEIQEVKKEPRGPAADPEAAPRPSPRPRPPPKKEGDPVLELLKDH